MSAIKICVDKKRRKESHSFLLLFFLLLLYRHGTVCFSLCAHSFSLPLFQPKKEKTPGKSKQVQANKAAAGAKSGKAGKSKAKKKVRLVFGFCSSREIIILTQLQNPEMV